MGAPTEERLHKKYSGAPVFVIYAYYVSYTINDKRRICPVSIPHSSLLIPNLLYISNFVLRRRVTTL